MPKLLENHVIQIFPHKTNTISSNRTNEINDKIIYKLLNCINSKCQVKSTEKSEITKKPCKTEQEIIEGAKNENRNNLQ